MLFSESIEFRNGIERGLVFITTSAQAYVLTRHCKINIFIAGGEIMRWTFNIAPAGKEASGFSGFG